MVVLIKLTTEGPDKLYQHIASRECDDASNPNYVEADEPPRLEIILKTDSDSDGDGVLDSLDNCPNKCNSDAALIQIMMVMGMFATQPRLCFSTKLRRMWYTTML